MAPTARFACFLLLSTAWPVAEPWAQPGEEPAPSQEEGPAVRRLGDVAGEEYQLDLSVPKAPREAITVNGEFGLPDPDQDERLQQLLNQLAGSPGDRAALAELDALLSELLDEANELMAEGRLEEAYRMMAVVRNVNPRKSGLADGEARLAQLHQIDDWVAAAEEAKQNGHLVNPGEGSALYYYRRVLGVDPGNAIARDGLVEIQETLLGYAVFRRTEDSVRRNEGVGKF